MGFLPDNEADLEAMLRGMSAEQAAAYKRAIDASLERLNAVEPAEVEGELSPHELSICREAGCDPAVFLRLKRARR